MNSLHRQDDQWLHDALRDLSQARDGAGSPTPDFSRSVMGRLGYMRVSASVARRRRLMKWANRAGMMCVAAVALFIGWRVLESSPQVRRPSDTTVPQAISRDMQQQQQRLGNMIQTIREISSPKFTPRLTSDFAPPRGEGSRRSQPAALPAPGAPGAPFSAEVQYRSGERPADQSSPELDPDDNPSGQQEMRDEVNRDSDLPVRWV